MKIQSVIVLACRWAGVEAYGATSATDGDLHGNHGEMK